MPKNIDILRKMDSTELAELLATDRIRLAQSAANMVNMVLPDDLKPRIVAVLKNWLEREVDG